MYQAGGQYKVRQVWLSSWRCPRADCDLITHFIVEGQCCFQRTLSERRWWLTICLRVCSKQVSVVHTECMRYGSSLALADLDECSIAALKRAGIPPWCFKL